MDLINLLFSIEQKRELYIGEGDLLALKHFISGYYVCMIANGIENNDSWWHCFDKFVHDYYAESSTSSLFECIVDHTSSKDSAFAHFFMLLHSYTNK